jgi:tetratricopeptide (TPR) repeat protein
MTTSPPSAPGREALDRAALAIRMQRPGEAERLAADVLAAHPEEGRAAVILGQALLMQNRAQEAIVPLQRLASRHDDPAVDLLLARAFDAAGQGEAALDRLGRAILRRPPLGQAFLEFGGRLAKTGRADEGIAVLEQGLALLPDFVPLRVGLGYLHLEAGRRGTARDLFAAAHAAAPERRDATIALAAVSALEGDHAAAVALYRQALEARPDDPVTRLNLARSLLQLGDRAAGEAALRAAVLGAPHLLRLAIGALCDAPHGRLFLRPSAAAAFFGVQPQSANRRR